MIQLSRAEIQSLVAIDERAVAAIRDAYIAITDGRAEVPPVGYLALAGRNADCHIKYGYIAGDPVFVVKIAAGFYDNPKIGLPSSNGIVLAFSARTGQVLAILNDEGWLTDLRTAIGGAVATLALARADFSRVAIVGTGTQARLQARAIAALAGRTLRFGIWGRSAEKAEAVAADLAAEGLQADAEPDLETLCRQADAIVTTTPSTQALIRSHWIDAGAHITAVGADSPGKCELDVELVARADRRVADKLDQCLDHGEFAGAHAAGLIAAADCVELGAVISGRATGRMSDRDITIADLTGVATQDIAIARTVLERLPGLTL